MGMNRKELRTALVAALNTYFGADVALIVGHLPKSLGGKSPVITVESGPTMPLRYATPDEPQNVGIIFGLWILREDAASAEDQLDDLAERFIPALDADFNVSWPHESKPEYLQVDGKDYRVEWYDALIEWW
jgi:hypothetical protein